MTYTYHRVHSPNTDRASVPRPARLVILHWWGTPSNQVPWDIIRHLCNPAPGGNPAHAVSAHAVVWAGNVAQLLDYRARSWANGDDYANSNAITIEADPNNPAATMDTIVEYLIDLITAGELDPDFTLDGHRDYYPTECPGTYYQWLPTIRDRVTNQLEGDNMQPITYTDRAGKQQTGSAEQVLGWIIGNQHNLLDQVAELRADVDTIKAEAVWLPPNFAGVMTKLEALADRMETRQ